jgi:endonuclease/exonuclease/phosphatase family metal-dependent hydrolase
VAAVTSVRVATWNVREGHAVGGDRPPKEFAEEAARLVNEYDIDVLALQEVDFDPAGRSAMISAIRGGTGLGHIGTLPLSPSSFAPRGRTGLAVASRYPLVGHQHATLPNPDLTVPTDRGLMHSFDKGLLECVVEIAGRRFSMVCVHLFPFRRFHRDAADPDFRSVWSTLGTLLAEGVTDPMVVAGDFNSADRRLVLDNTDVTLIPTMAGRPTHGDLSVDEIFYSSGLIAVRTEVIDSLSDHALCLVELAWA